MLRKTMARCDVSFDREMKPIALACLLLVVLPIGLPPRQTSAAASTLADTINSLVSGTSWSGDAAVISVGTIFGKTGTSAFDSATGNLDDNGGAAWVRMVASEDGYTSQTLDSKVQSMMASMPMTDSLPITDTKDGNVFLDDDRYVIPLYDEFSGWNKTSALAELQSNLQGQGGKPLLAFGSGGGWYYAERYYDEWIQDLDIMLKMGDAASAATLWAGVNSAPPVGNWNGQDYVYRPDSSTTLECEVGFFAAVVANYEATVGSIPHFDRVSTDLYNKLLVNGWSSPLWGAPSWMRHATDNGQLRLQNTLGGIEALQMYYTVSDSAYRSAFVSLLTGSTPAWQEFTGSSLFSQRDSSSNAMKAALLLLYGIIPDSGSLAVPTNEWHYEDWTSMMPSTLFRFDYDGHTIQIPVLAGNIKFDFGSSITSYIFPSNGVYQVQFSSDWNTVVSTTLIESLSFPTLLGRGSVTPPKVDLTITTFGDGTTYPATGVYQYDKDSVVTVSATPADGWVFTEWQKNGIDYSSQATLTILLDASFTMNAIFTAIPPSAHVNLTVTSLGEGTTTPAEGIYQYYVNSTVILTATPADGWSFVFWSGDLTGSANPADLTIMGDMAVTATFTQNQYTLGVTVVGSGSVSSSPDQPTYTWGTDVTLNANADIGWVFSGWSGDASGTINPITVTITANMAAAATFTRLTEHDVATTNLTTSKTGSAPMPTVGQNFTVTVNVTVVNVGDYNESTVNVTAYATPSIGLAIVIDSATVSLGVGSNTTITFTWNTTGVAYDNYTISAAAGPVTGETNTSDNNFTGGVVKVTIPGDLNGDFNVGLADLVALARAYSSTPTDPNWNPNTDIDGDSIVGLSDLVILAQNYGQHYP